MFHLKSLVKNWISHNGIVCLSEMGQKVEYIQSGYDAFEGEISEDGNVFSSNKDKDKEKPEDVRDVDREVKN